MWACKNCSKENRNDRDHCWHCGTPIDETTAKDDRPPSMLTRREKPSKAQAINDELQISPMLPRGGNEYVSSNFFVSALKVCAWMALIAGITGGIWLWSNAPDDIGVLKSLRVQFLANALALAIQGFVVWVLFNVVAAIAENVEIIREKISRETKR